MYINVISSGVSELLKGDIILPFFFFLRFHAYSMFTSIEGENLGPSSRGGRTGHMMIAFSVQCEANRHKALIKIPT